MRHNALHIAAKANQAAITALVLDILLDVEFTKLLYSSSHDTEQSRHQRISYLVDLYLNSPDKGVGPHESNLSLVIINLAMNFTFYSFLFL